MHSRGFPRIVVLGGGAGQFRVLTGLAAHMPGEVRHRQHNLLTAIVQRVADLGVASALVGDCACVLPATADAGPVRRVYPETLRRIITADLIVAGPCDGNTLEAMLGVGGFASTLSAVNAVRVLVTAPQAEWPSDREAAMGRLWWGAGLFDYWLSGSSSPHAADPLIDDLHGLLAIATLAGSQRNPLIRPLSASGLASAGRAIGRAGRPSPLARLD